MLRCMGFCGADDTVEPAKLKEISEKHEWVEWGVLFRPDREGLPRYASRAWVELGSSRRGRCKLQMVLYLYHKCILYSAMCKWYGKNIESSDWQSKDTAVT